MTITAIYELDKKLNLFTGEQLRRTRDFVGILEAYQRGEQSKEDVQRFFHELPQEDLAPFADLLQTLRAITK